jgi:hypothetical protein
MGAIDEPQPARPSALNAALPSWGIVLCICWGRPRVCCNTNRRTRVHKKRQLITPSLRFPLLAGGTKTLRFPSRSGGNLKEGVFNLACFHKLCPRDWYYTLPRGSGCSIRLVESPVRKHTSPHTLCPPSMATMCRKQARGALARPLACHCPACSAALPPPPR